jgi:hypothetical protein
MSIILYVLYTDGGFASWLASSNFNFKYSLLSARYLKIVWKYASQNILRMGLKVCWNSAVYSYYL